MNLIGKVFVVLIFILSVLFMGFSVVVYATHKNWKRVVDNSDPRPGEQKGLKQQVEDQNNSNRALRAELDKLLQDLANEQAARRFVLATLQTKLQQEQEELNAASRELLQLQQASALKAQALKSNSETLAKLTDEVGGLRTEIRDTQIEMDKHFMSVVSLVDQVNQLEDIRRRLREQEVQMGHRLANMLAVMNRFGLKETDLVAHIEPPGLDGVVLQTTRDLVEISIGSDDGLKKGHKLDVFRRKTYVGQIIIVKTEPNKAVAKIVRELQNSEVRKGDRVATKLS